MSSFFVAIAFVCHAAIGCLAVAETDVYFKTEKECIKHNTDARKQMIANIEGMKASFACAKMEQPKPLVKSKQS